MATSKVPVEETTTSEDGSSVAVPKLLDRYADESYKLLSQVKVEPPTPEEAERIRKKCVRWVIPFICLGYHLMYVDKQTVSDLVTAALLRRKSMADCVNYSLATRPFSVSSTMRI